MNRLKKSVFQEEISFFMAVPALVWQSIFFYVPLVLIIFLSFVRATQQPGQGLFTLEHYATFAHITYGAIIVRSLAVAFMSAIICNICAYPIAYYCAFVVRRYKTQLLFFLVLPFWINVLVQVYAWFFVLEKKGLLNSLLLKSGIIDQPLSILNTPWAVFLVMVYCYLPFAIMPIYSVLEKFDKRLLEASADLGATPWQTFMRVTLPLSASGLRNGFFLVFVPAFGEFVIPTLVSGAKQLYVGSLVSHYFLTVRNFNLGAAFTCLMGLILVFIGVGIYLFFKRFFGLTKGGV